MKAVKASVASWTARRCGASGATFGGESLCIGKASTAACPRNECRLGMGERCASNLTRPKGLGMNRIEGAATRKPFLVDGLGRSRRLWSAMLNALSAKRCFSHFSRLAHCATGRGVPWRSLLVKTIFNRIRPVPVASILIAATAPFRRYQYGGQQTHGTMATTEVRR